MLRTAIVLPGAEQAWVLRPAETGIYTNPFQYFSDVIRGWLNVPPYGLYSMAINLLLVRIVDAARESAKTGRTVTLR